MSKSIIFRFSVILMLLLTAGCSSATLEESQKEAVEAAKDTFESPVEEASEETENFHFHLPSGASIKEKNANNVIIENGNHTYILFYNQNVSSDSEQLYELSVQDETDLLKQETFRDDERFGYFLIREVEEEQFELTAGIGGTKMTTQSVKDDMASDSEFMMEVVSSVKNK
ncbi:hypothetical protein FZC84_15130 [Rossellomorea vietnamensis]|uniref:Lipoprotein n=1 Tax=Rossellomorea vietnamensis TaxID=218284 RepID=A0A5D4MA94_9BACI|nr:MULTISPECIES: hypothetical protein [Bacillaceae]TYR98243.1 hypothetical protein FZC84_15130 [Rossellomorea vietnamensis]